VTFIDKSGERLLRAMSKKGAELIATGIYTKHLLEKAKATGKDSLSKLLVCFFAAAVVTPIISADCAQVGRTLATRNARRSLVSRLGEHATHIEANSSTQGKERSRVSQ
jgi:hypothetical protein